MPYVPAPVCKDFSFVGQAAECVCNRGVRPFWVFLSLLGTLFPSPSQAQVANFHFLGRQGRWITSLAFSPDGKVLYSGSVSAKAGESVGKLWEIPSGKEVRSFGQGQRVTLSSDGKLFASFEKGKGSVYDTSTGVKRIDLDLEGLQPRRIAFSPDKTLLAIAYELSDEKTTEIGLWEVVSGKRVRRFGHWESQVPGLAFSKNGKTLASGNLDGSVQLWDVKSGDEAAVLTSKTDRAGGVATLLAFSQDGRYVAASDWTTIVVWDVTVRRQVATLPFKGYGQAFSLAFSPDGRFLVAGGEFESINYLLRGNMVVTWQVEGWKRFEHCGGVNPGDPICCLAFSPDSNLLAMGSAQGHVWLFELKKPK